MIGLEYSKELGNTNCFIRYRFKLLNYRKGVYELFDKKKKIHAAKAVIPYIPQNAIIGIGSGSTVNIFIKELLPIKKYITGAVAASTQTEKLLNQYRIKIYDLNEINSLPIYIDSADAYNSNKQLVKGMGGALTREKMIAYNSNQFICIVDDLKDEKILYNKPIPLEVLPIAKNFVAREIAKLSWIPVYRSNFITDNGNIILDIFNLITSNSAINIEQYLNNIPGVIDNGIFAKRNADIIIIGKNNNVSIIK